ncbi:MetQ/NlpA family ABC transporter substrate-binding protein [Nigerium massiliense]|uniref:MetQ/NlpA family ABC transporter substrate-binding protein n=1 Tax=Nigerium massiliense TaxID=1522317 RepID=UPI00058D095D|nr:MetQ/NlpA family ABC transporter substrate-binding protein [Nigerium massiliense]
MNRLLRTVLALAAAITLAVGLSGCGANASGSNAPLRVMADVRPHAELIKKAQELGLLGDVKVEVQEISGSVDPNQLVQAGDIDANFFQHVPYLNDWNASHNANLVQVGKPVHVEPLGLYSKKVASVAATPQGAKIAIPADPTNQGRALFLLADAGLITLNVKADDPNLNYAQVTKKNITGNPKNLSFIEIERPQLAASLDDPQVTLSIINGNYAIEAGLNPSTDAKAIEKSENNPYANVLVTRQELKDDPRVQKLAEALTSDKIQQYIRDTYKGSVVPYTGSVVPAKG